MVDSKRLRDLTDATISYGVVQPGIHSAGGVPILRVQDLQKTPLDVSGLLKVDGAISGKHGKTVLHGGELLISLVGTVGLTKLVPKTWEGFNVARAIGVIRSQENPWLQLAFESPQVKDQILQVLNTTVQATLNLRDLTNIFVPFPSDAKRSGILHVINSIDQKIEANAKLAIAADSLACSLYLRATGAGARSCLMSEVTEVTYGEPFKGALFCQDPEGRPLIRIRDLKTFTPQIWTIEERPRETVIEDGNLLVGMDAEFRATKWVGGNALLNQRVLKISSEKLGTSLLMSALARPLEEVERSKTATTVIHLNKSDLDRMHLLVPDDLQLASLRRECDDLYALSVDALVENKQLSKLRDYLLPRLMSEKITVRDAEDSVSAVF